MTNGVKDLEQRLQAIEELLDMKGAYSDDNNRITAIKVQIYSNKEALTFAEACVYLDVSQSLLYKLTSTNAIPHYKPRGKMVYFSRAELDRWMLSNQIIK